MSIRIGDYLTRRELFELTGVKHGAKQLAWLRSRGWAHETAARGEIRVLRAYRDQKFGIAKKIPSESASADCHAILRAYQASSSMIR